MLKKNPLIITCAITGAEVSKDKQPALPITPREQGVAADEAVKAGAAIIHLHVREDDGTPSQRVERFREAITEIKSRVPDVIIQISTGGAVGETMENRLKPLVLKPEMATLNMGTMNFGDEVFYNHPKDIEKLAGAIYENGIVPELEIYDVGMLETAARLVKKGVLREPLFMQFVLGVPGGMSGDPRNFLHLLEMKKTYFSPETHWAVAGIGRFELPLAKQAVELGGHVRVGLEDNIYYEKGVLAKSNAHLVKRVAELAGKIGRKAAAPKEVRKMIGIKN